MSRRRSTRVSTTPLAVTSDGTLLLNVAMTDGPTDPRQLVERAMAQGSPVFVGVVLGGRDRRIAMTRMIEATDETASWISGRQRRRRPRSRIRRSTTS